MKGPTLLLLLAALPPVADASDKMDVVVMQNGPEANVQFSFTLYPSLAEGGRVRGDAHLSLKRELWHDFTIGLDLPGVDPLRGPAATPEPRIGYHFRGVREQYARS